jgi:hypothetical protein
MNQGWRRYKDERAYCFPREPFMRKHWKCFLFISKRGRGSDIGHAHTALDEGWPGGLLGRGLPTPRARRD